MCEAEDILMPRKFASTVPVSQEQADGASEAEPLLRDFIQRRMDGEPEPNGVVIHPEVWAEIQAWERLPFWRQWIYRIATRVAAWAFPEPDGATYEDEDEW